MSAHAPTHRTSLTPPVPIHSDQIVENSKSYINTLLVLIYLFIAVFILLAMFLAILGTP